VEIILLDTSWLRQKIRVPLSLTRTFIFVIDSNKNDVQIRSDMKNLCVVDSLHSSSQVSKI